MPTESSYPAALDIITDPSTTLKGPSGSAHQDAHLHLNDAVERIEAELGVNPSGDDPSVAVALNALKDDVAGLTPAYWAGAATADWLDTANTTFPSSRTGTLDLAVSRAHVTRIGRIVTISADLKIDLSGTITYPASSTTTITVNLTKIGDVSEVFSGGLEQIPHFPCQWSPQASTGDWPAYPATGAVTTSTSGGSAVITVSDSRQVSTVTASRLRVAFVLTFRASL